MGPDLGTVLAADRAVQRYEKLSEDEKLQLFERVQSYRGLVLNSQKDFEKSFYDVVSWQRPDHNRPRPLTIIKSSYTFSKVIHYMLVYGVDKASAELATPYVSGKAEFEHIRQKETDSTQITTYLLIQYIARKVLLSIDPKKLQPTAEFACAVQEAISGKESSIDGYVNLLDVLNKYGQFVPIEFTLGGMLYSRDETKVSSYAEAETEHTSFASDFKVEFEKMGGGVAYGKAEGTKNLNKTEHQHRNVTIEQIGGIEGTVKDFGKWIESLDIVETWDVATYDKLLPTIALLDEVTLSACIRLIDRFHLDPAVRENGQSN